MRQAALAVIAAKARGLGLLAAAVLAGGIAMAALPSSAASGGAGSHHAQNKATPHATDAPDAGGVHGQCVSKVARDKSAVGGPHHNHGGAVSAAAHNCPHG
jgi:hypothetical protein